MNQTGGPAMVNIDGSKVKSIRENQGLTQLYVATAVGVTTDTISRWENKRYPKIKKENGLKLAESLEVNLEDLLEEVPTENISPDLTPSPTIEKNEISESSHKQITSSTSATIPSATIKFKNKTKAIGFASIIMLILIVTALLLLQKSQNSMTISANRHLPTHYIPGAPFPVAISINFESKKDQSYVVKEQLPESSKILHTTPKAHLKGTKSNTLKWLKKAKMGNRFTYVVTLPQNVSDTKQIFTGSVSHGMTETRLEIRGNTQTKASIHHWADSDSDNRISDQEILSAYDLYNGALGIDFNLIEEIWMGTGYRWDPAKNAIVLLP